MSCEHCVNCITLHKHPWNKNYKGKVSEKTNLYACIVEHDLEENRKAIIMEDISIGCELFYHKNQTEINQVKKFNL